MDNDPAVRSVADSLAWQDVLGALRRRYIWVLLLPVVLAGAAFAASYLVEPRYRSMAVLIPQQGDQQQGLLGSLAGQFGGLAALAGVDLGGAANKYEAIEVLRSRSLAEEFINQRDLLPVLFHEQWDTARLQWRSDSDDVPTVEDGVRELDQHVVAVSEDRRTGVVTLSVTWSDRDVAADWANDLVRRANARMQARSIAETRRSLEFLEKKASSEESVAVRESLYKIIEGQYRSMALASAREDFAFRVIDSAAAPDVDDFVSPRRAVFAAVGGFLGLLLAGGLLVSDAQRWAGRRGNGSPGGGAQA